MFQRGMHRDGAVHGVFRVLKLRLLIDSIFAKTISTVVLTQARPASSIMNQMR